MRYKTLGMKFIGQLRLTPVVKYFFFQCIISYTGSYSLNIQKRQVKEKKSLRLQIYIEILSSNYYNVSDFSQSRDNFIQDFQ